MLQAKNAKNAVMKMAEEGKDWKKLAVKYLAMAYKGWGGGNASKKAEIILEIEARLALSAFFG